MKSPLNALGGRKRDLLREIRENERIVELTRDDGDIEAVKKRGQALWGIGGALMELERFAEALPFYEDADPILWQFENLHAAAVVGCTQRGLALMELGRTDEALEVFTGVIDKVGLRAATADLPDLITTAIEMRLALLEAPGRIEELDIAAEAVIDALDPGSTQRKRRLLAQAVTFRGAAARARGDYEAALAAFDEAIERAQSESIQTAGIQARALSGRARVLADTERTGEAIVVCDEVLDRFGHDQDDAWTVIAVASVEQLKKELNI